MIEDDYLIAAHVAEVAVTAGASTVAIAPTQAAAVAEALQHPPAMILSDGRLLEGTGPAAVDEIIAALGPIPVVFITGSPDECRAGPTPVAILVKPFVSQTLVSVMQGLVRG